MVAIHAREEADLLMASLAVAACLTLNNKLQNKYLDLLSAYLVVPVVELLRK